jgi:hypothetical protein
MSEGVTSDPWRYRRRFLTAYTLFTMGVLGYIVFTGQDTETARSIITTAFPSLAALVGAYVFGAAWENKR